MVNVMAKRNSKNTNTFFFFLAALVLFVAWGAFSMTNQVEATLRTEGYKNIQVGSYAMWACTSTESPTLWASSFAATQNGHHVEGAVCCAATCQVRQY